LGRPIATDKESAEVTEMAAFVSIKKTVLRQQKTAYPRRLGQPEQLQRFVQLLADYPLAALAAELHLTPEDLIDIWSFSQGDSAAQAGFAEMVARTGTTSQARALAARLACAHGPADAVVALAGHFTPAAERTWRTLALREKLTERTEGLLAALKPDTADAVEVISSPLWRQLTADLAEQDAIYQKVVDDLALLCTQAAAAEVLSRRPMAAGPIRLDLFQLSAELQPPTEGS
jgi:hypothetical protein